MPSAPTTRSNVRGAPRVERHVHAAVGLGERGDRVAEDVLAAVLRALVQQLGEVTPADLDVAAGELTGDGGERPALRVDDGLVVPAGLAAVHLVEDAHPFRTVRWVSPLKSTAWPTGRRAGRLLDDGDGGAVAGEPEASAGPAMLAPEMRTVVFFMRANVRRSRCQPTDSRLTVRLVSCRAGCPPRSGPRRGTGGRPCVYAAAKASAPSSAVARPRRRRHDGSPATSCRAGPPPCPAGTPRGPRGSVAARPSTAAASLRRPAVTCRASATASVVPAQRGQDPARARCVPLKSVAWSRPAPRAAGRRRR